MSEEPSSKPKGQVNFLPAATPSIQMEVDPTVSPFERFKAAMRSILSVPKSAVIEEERKQKKARMDRRKA